MALWGFFFCDLTYLRWPLWMNVTPSIDVPWEEPTRVLNDGLVSVLLAAAELNKSLCNDFCGNYSSLFYSRQMGVVIVFWISECFKNPMFVMINPCYVKSFMRRFCCFIMQQDFMIYCQRSLISLWMLIVLYVLFALPLNWVEHLT